MRLFFTVTLLLWVTLSAVPKDAAGRWIFHAVNVRNGLADNFVRDITTDSKGYIWLSTINGDNKAEEVTVPQNSTIPTILAVEDNTDARLFLQRSLGGEYHILTAPNSKEALNQLVKADSLAVLRLRIRKILEWTQHVHEQVATGIDIKPSEITVSSLDEELISHVISEVEANIGNPKMFAQYFREMYVETPSNYLKRQRQKPIKTKYEKD